MTLVDIAPSPIATQKLRSINIARSLPFYFAFASAASIIFSIAISQILLGLGLAALAIRRERLRFPAIVLPLALFFAATVIADLASGHPLEGFPQIRKFFVFGILLLVFNTFETIQQIKALLVTWTGIAVLSAGRGFLEVINRHQEAIRLRWNTYDYYLDDRIKGFASHWMTFGAEQMIVMLMVLAFLLFARPARWKIYGGVALCILWISLMLGLTRSIFLLGAPAGSLYLLLRFKPWTLVLIPVAALCVYYAGPFQVRERIASVLQPHGELDSNTHRSVTRRTGWEMVKAHPWLGLGPEQIKPQFDAYVPRDVRRPLPHGWYGHLHNIYLQYAAERGIPALVCIMWMIGKMLWDFLAALRLRNLSPDATFLVHGAVAVIIAVLAEGFFEYNLGDSEVLTMFLVVAACAYLAIGREAAPCS